MKTFSPIYKLSNLKIFLMICLSNIAISFLSKKLLINEEVFYNTVNEQMSYYKAIELFGISRKFFVLGLFMIPILIGTKAYLVSFLLYIGFIFTNRMYDVSISQILKVCLVSESVFVLSYIIKLIILSTIKTPDSIIEINYYQPFSIAALFDYSQIDQIWYYPFQTASLFQVLFIFALSKGLEINCNISKNDADGIVIYTYVPALILWTLLIIFLSSQ